MHFFCKLHTFSFHFEQWGHSFSFSQRYLHNRPHFWVIHRIHHNTQHTYRLNVVHVPNHVICQPIVQPHYHKTSAWHYARNDNPHRRYDVLHLFAGVFVLVFVCYLVLVLLVLLFFHSNTRFKWVARQTLTMVFPFLSFWKRYRSAVKFSQEYTVHSHGTMSFITQNGNKAVNLASTAVTAKEMFFIAWKTIMVITTSYVWPHWLNWKEYVCNLHENCIPQFPTLS